MHLRDALFNWLQISLVAEARPDDAAAQDTKLFFEEILREDHGLSSFDKVMDEDIIQVRYIKDDQEHEVKFDSETAQQLLTDINSNPKYNE